MQVMEDNEIIVNVFKCELVNNNANEAYTVMYMDESACACIHSRTCAFLAVKQTNKQQHGRVRWALKQ